MYYFRAANVATTMKNLKVYFAFLMASALLWSCKKSPDYTATPFACNCGTIEWQGVQYDILGANYILSDSTESESRRYYFTTDIALDGETETHGLSAWIQVDNLDGGGQFEITPAGVEEFTAWFDEFNENDPISELRQYVPVNAVISVAEAPISGGTETVYFQITLNQLVNGNPIAGDVNCSGSFSLYINQ